MRPWYNRSSSCGPGRGSSRGSSPKREPQPSPFSPYSPASPFSPLAPFDLTNVNPNLFEGRQWTVDDLTRNRTLERIQAEVDRDRSWDRPLTFKQSVAWGLALSVGKSAWNGVQYYRYTRERERRIEAERERQAAEQRAEEERRRAEEERQRAEEERQRAERERQDREDLEKHMRDLGIDPAEPNISDGDIEDARRVINYDAAVANIVVAGNLNAGKSSLLNAIRNLKEGDPDWAPTGASEVTAEQHRYPDLAQNCVWYDTPGAGTQNVTAFRYYYNQKLFAYDKVVLVHETTLTESDIRLLQVCEHFKQPCIVVRTKSDMHIYNYQQEREWDWAQAREEFLSEVRQDVTRFREQAEASQAKFVPDFDDFVVSTSGIRGFVRKERSPNEVDEARFFEALGL